MNGTSTDQWQPAIAVKPDGSKLFLAWYDRRNSPNNSEIEVWGVIADLPIGGAGSFANNFKISTTSFPPVFTGTLAANRNAGMFDPAYPPLGRTDQPCPQFRAEQTYDDGSPQGYTEYSGAYSHHMGDYDAASADNEYVYHSWSDKREQLGARHEANVRFVRIPWK